jgi:hypothetical protein
MTRVVLIDPEARSIKQLTIDKPLHIVGEELLKTDKFDLSTRIAEFEESWDYLMVDDTGLSRAEPIHAFKFAIRKDPIAGPCLIYGVDKESRDTVDAKMEVDFLRNGAVEWLGLIKPEVTWVGTRAVVTYSRVKP